LKSFTRAGGFKGTAIKPMWTIHRMTEVFGPCGTGWGINEPKFELIPCGDELAVFCNVSVWYEKPTQTLRGVGGDKVLTKQTSGIRSDDEAYKKAFTDAVTNALKHLGAGADVHMGLWDGNKYSEDADAPQKPKAESRGEYDRLSKGIKQIIDIGTIEDLKLFIDNNKKSINALPSDWYNSLMEEKDDAKAALMTKRPGLNPLDAG
jgi:hypothetical protein